MDRGAWWATIHRAAESWAGLKQPSTHIIPYTTVLWYYGIMLHIESLHIKFTYSLHIK